MNKVQIIADSKNEFGQRLITAVLTFPRYLLAEVNTHRMLSRNSASSRAIRFEKMVESVMNNPFIPFKWQKDHAGMQGSEYLDGDHFHGETSIAIANWYQARDRAVRSAKDLNNLGVTKQICNRLLEPFMYHTALVSGTELENFFALRAQDAAEIHFQDLAYKFLDACNESTPKELKAGDWHVPYGEDFNIPALDKILMATGNYLNLTEIPSSAARNLMIKIAAVRAARISYAVPGSEMKHDYEADLKLHDRLASSGHWSAFEHCAQAMSKEEFYSHVNGVIPIGIDNDGSLFSHEYYPFAEDKDRMGFVGENVNNGTRYGWSGNFRGFIQYRKMFDNENRSDSRLIQK